MSVFKFAILITLITIKCSSIVVHEGIPRSKMESIFDLKFNPWAHKIYLKELPKNMEDPQNILFNLKCGKDYTNNSLLWIREDAKIAELDQKVRDIFGINSMSKYKLYFHQSMF